MDGHTTDRISPEVYSGISENRPPTHTLDPVLDIPAAEAKLTRLKQRRQPDEDKIEGVATWLSFAYSSIGCDLQTSDLVANNPDGPLSIAEQEQYDNAFKRIMNL